MDRDNLTGHQTKVDQRDHEGVFETDAQLKLIRINHPFSQILGHPEEAIKSQSLLSFIDKRYVRMAYQAFSKVYVNRKGFKDLIWEIVDSHGQRKVIESSANLMIDKEGERTGFRGIVKDLTEKSMAEVVFYEATKRYQGQFRVSRRGDNQLGSLLNFVPYPMVVLDLDGKVIFLNPAFTRIFGWSLEELRGRKTPYVPPELQEETKTSQKRLLDHRVLHRHETRRLTKDGRLLDVVMKGAVYTTGSNIPGGELIILRDITQEKRMTRINEAMLRISMALPKYPDLENLLDYISDEMKQLLNTEGALVILLDEKKKELYYLGAAYDEKSTQQRAKEIRFATDGGIAGRVIRTGEAVIVPDTARDPGFSSIVDEKLGYRSSSILDVPLKSGDRIIGVLCASNKKEGAFEQKDIELLNMIAGTVALSIENARFSRELHAAYEEVKSLNKAKDKAINHLSHELRTPIAILRSALNILEKDLESHPARHLKVTFERAHRNLRRIMDIQNEVEDIMQDRGYQAFGLLNALLDQCVDELESLFAEVLGEGDIIGTVRNLIEESFGPKTSEVSDIMLDQFLQERLRELGPQFSPRDVEIVTSTERVPYVRIPAEILGKVVDGLVRNAIENTPDAGKIDITVEKKGEGSQLIVSDSGVGITENSQKRIFEGFFPTQETMTYSSKAAFDFNAGGKGADLLRMKIFAERYHFKIDLESLRCRFIPEGGDQCPGAIGECGHCKNEEDCYGSGGTNVTVFFPGTNADKCPYGSEK